jgi:erythromycin esterase-like protein
MKDLEPTTSLNEQLIHTATLLAQPFEYGEDLTPLIQKLKTAKVVMLGEATHGTQEFYQVRRLISQRLIAEHGFNFIAVEGDWPDCAHIHRHVVYNQGEDAPSVLQAFHRWPTWMWANTEIIKLVEWLHSYNDDFQEEEKSGFFGLDVYSLFESIDSVIRTLSKYDPKLATVVRRRYSCFEPFHRDEMAYTRSLLEDPGGCLAEVVANLKGLLELRIDNESKLPGFDLLDVQQNAKIVHDAERYYRTMVFSDANSWNVRDSHMLETLETLMHSYGKDSKAIVWAHNTHIGDYRYTDMKSQGYVNIGGLAREKFGEDNVCLVGFGTYQGSVVAGHAWGAPHEVMQVPKAQPASLEHHLHLAAERWGGPSYFMIFNEAGDERAAARDQTMTTGRDISYDRSVLEGVFNHRAIGVVYDPRHEARSNYVPTIPAKRYDAFVFVDRSTALDPLETQRVRGEIPETYPTGI